MTQKNISGNNQIGKTRYYDPTLPNIPQKVDIIDVQVIDETDSLRTRVEDLEYSMGVVITDNIRLTAENDTMRVWFMGIVPAFCLVLFMVMVNISHRVSRVENSSIPVPPAASQNYYTPGE